MPTRRHVLQVFLVFWLASAGWQGRGADRSSPSGERGSLRVYLGTYTRGESRGIYLSRLDLPRGKLSPAVLAAEAVNPSFLAISPDQRFLYAVGEISDFSGAKSGAVSAYSIEPESGLLRLLNQRPSQGAGPCHLVVDQSARHVLVANYGGGSIASLPVLEDGRLGPASCAIQHSGSSVDPRRQQGPHAHSINLDPANRFAMVADLGLDKILIYRFDSRRGSLAPHDPPWLELAPGAGPRHFAFHPEGRLAFVINELKCTITSLRYDARRGRLEVAHEISTLPQGFEGSNTTAEVQVHPSGEYVYGSNRGHDSIAAFAVDRESGRLSLVGHAPTGGRTPRNFGIDPTGAYLLAANQDSSNVAVFRVDARTGALTASGEPLSVANPVCVKMLESGP